MKKLIEFCRGLEGDSITEAYLELHTKAERSPIAKEATVLANRLLWADFSEGSEKIAEDDPKSDAITISAAMLRALIEEAIDGVQQWRLNKDGDEFHKAADGEWMDTDDVNRLPDVIMVKVMEEAS